MSDKGLRRVYPPQRNLRDLRQSIKRETPGVVEDKRLTPNFAGQLERYLAGERVEFDVRLDWSAGTPFQRDAWRACRKIPYGETRTYKDLAERVGRPRGARAVGMALARNPLPIVVPCHRVLKSGGGLGGFSAPGGPGLKKRLLEMESAAT